MTVPFGGALTTVPETLFNFCVTSNPFTCIKRDYSKHACISIYMLCRPTTLLQYNERSTTPPPVHDHKLREYMGQLKDLSI